MTSVNCSRPSPLPRPPPPRPKPPALAVTCQFPRPDRSLLPQLRFLHTPPPPALTCLSHAHSAQPTPAPPPVCVGPRRWLRAASSAPRCLLAAPQPLRPAVPGAANSPAAAPARPAPPRLHRRSRWRTHQRSPPPPSPPPAARPLGQPGRDARTRRECPGPGTRARAQSAARPRRGASPGSRRGLPDPPAGGGGVGGRHSPALTRFKATDPGATSGMSLRLARSPAVRLLHNLERVGSLSAPLTRPCSSPPPPRTQHS
ncbi:uncharacterized protein [Bos indicus]|uniref:Basic proline-rich protein-like n=1 Tax=Bos indicus TaxID=9915 RepID=A0ABM4R481_BOSIN